MTATLAALLLALVLDWFAGEPQALWRRIPHPVVLAGRLIGWLDRTFNRAESGERQRFRAGAAIFIGLGVAAMVPGVLLAALFSFLGPLAWVAEGLVAFTLIAQKSMRDHAAAVANALREEGLEAGRRQVSQIVGRDPAALDESGVARASIESLAENFSDGVVAPAFWFAVGGLPALFAYKMVNTADSMIGHRSDRHEQFGKAAAIADDIANWLPARLSALLVAAGGWLAHGGEAGARSIALAMRDAGLHRSPNAGWPEAAMAGAMDFQLGGPRIYAGETVAQAYLNGAGRPVKGVADIKAAQHLFDLACCCLWGLVALLLAVSLVVAA